MLTILTSSNHKLSLGANSFPSIRLKNITVKSLIHLARKLPKVTNQHIMTCFCTLTIYTSFSVILLLFPIHMVKTCSEQKYTTLNTKTCQKWKPTQDNYIFHPNILHIVFGHFVVVSHQYDSKYITVKSLGHLTRKLAKVTNQHLMTSFCTQTIRKSFSVILLLFPINMAKKMLITKVRNPKHENLPKMEINPR